MKTAASSPTSPRAMDTIKRSEARDVVHIHGDDVAMKKEPYEYCKQQDLSLRRIERVCASTLASKIHQKEVRSTHAKLKRAKRSCSTTATRRPRWRWPSICTSRGIDCEARDAPLEVVPFHVREHAGVRRARGGLRVQPQQRKYIMDTSGIFHKAGDKYESLERSQQRKIESQLDIGCGWARWLSRRRSASPTQTPRSRWPSPRVPQSSRARPMQAPVCPFFITSSSTFWY